MSKRKLSIYFQCDQAMAVHHHGDGVICVRRYQTTPASYGRLLALFLNPAVEARVAMMGLCLRRKDWVHDEVFSSLAWPERTSEAQTGTAPVASVGGCLRSPGLYEAPIRYLSARSGGVFRRALVRRYRRRHPRFGCA
jgi:hypothetical protein